MFQRSQLIKFSIALLILNFLIGGLVVLNDINNEKEINKAREESSVLGVNSNIPSFNRNFILSDETFSSKRVFPTQNSIQRYLESVNSPLKNYVVDGRPASYWIFSASNGVTSSKWGIVPNINPGVILAFLEKEQSLLSRSGYNVYTDPENRIKTAMGYGCPDTARCDADYFGFVNQVNWGAYQLQYNYNFADSGRNVFPYKTQQTITTLDEYNVFLTNRATASVYRYTPHVYWGNYNLWKIIVANGWGVSTNTYSVARIDEVNLANKDINISIDSGSTVSLSQVQDKLQNGCRLGETGEDIKLLQRYLRQQGYYMTREITGMCGTTTRKAIEIYFGRAGGLSDRLKTINTTEVKADSFNTTQAIGLNVRKNPCGELISDVASESSVIWGTKGVISGQPQTQSCLGSRWNWYNVNWEDGKAGWSASFFMDEVEGTERKETIRTNNRNENSSALNLRDSACGNRIGTVSWGRVGEVLGETTTSNCRLNTDSWIRVRFDNGQQGWVARRYTDDI